MKKTNIWTIAYEKENMKKKNKYEENPEPKKNMKRTENV